MTSSERNHERALTRFPGCCVNIVARLFLMSARLVSTPHALTLVCCVMSATMAADTVKQKRSYNLPKGDASTTLNLFAEVSGQHIIFMVAKVRGVRTNAVVGEFSSAEALDRMLVDTDLQMTKDADTGAVVVSRKQAEGPQGRPGDVGSSAKPNPKKNPMKRSSIISHAVAMLGLLATQAVDAQTTPPTPRTDEVLVLDPFSVRSGEDVGYYATNAISATRVNKALIDLPISINVVTAEFMADINAFTLDEALKYTAGVNSEGFNSNTFSIRGFTAGSTFRDGVAPAAGGNEIPTSLVDRVEVVKGPSALLYGQGTAGGVVNFTTKKPLQVQKNNLRFIYGSHKTTRAEFDFTGPVPGMQSQIWKVLYRVTGQYQNGNTHLDYNSINDFAVNPMLTFIHQNNTRFDIQYTYQRRTENGFPEAIAALAVVPLTDPRFAGIFDVAELQARIAPDVLAALAQRLRASPGYANVGHSYNPEPPSAHHTKLEHVLTTTLQHSFTPNITLRSVSMYWDHHNFNYQRVGSIETAALPGYVTQQGALRWIVQRNSTIQTDLSIKSDLDSVKNQLVLGHLWRQTMQKFELYRDTDLKFPINRPPVFPDDYFLGDPSSIMNGTAIWNGKTTNNNMTGTDFNFFVQNTLTKQEGQAVYLIDMVELFHQRLVLLGGLRIENINGSASTAQRAPFFVGESVLSSSANLNQHSTNLGQYAAMFKLTPNISAYAAYSESYQPNGSFPNDPQQGKGYDLGLKFSLNKGRLSGRVSYFDINLTNVQRTDLSNPDPASRNIAVLTKGEASKGVEVDVFYAPNSATQLVFSWANIASRVVDNPESPDLIGQALVETPRNQLNLFATYRFPSGPLKGLRFGGGMNSRSATRSFSTGDRRYLLNPAVIRFDAFADYRVKLSSKQAIVYRLNLKNVTDKVVVLHQKWGAGLEWQASLNYQF